MIKTREQIGGRGRKKTKIEWYRYVRIYLLLSKDDREREKKNKKPDKP